MDGYFIKNRFCFVLSKPYVRRLLGCGIGSKDAYGVTHTRCKLFGAKTPWNRVRLALGLGTRAANFAMKSTGSKITWVVPSRYGVLSS